MCTKYTLYIFYLSHYTNSGNVTWLQKWIIKFFNFVASQLSKGLFRPLQ